MTHSGDLSPHSVSSTMPEGVQGDHKTVLASVKFNMLFTEKPVTYLNFKKHTSSVSKEEYIHMHRIVERKLDYEFRDMLSSHNLAKMGLQTSNVFLLSLISNIYCS